ncbi:MAG: RHS repeat-associated core domain-containing protein [Caulobacteraceae bacterium]
MWTYDAYGQSAAPLKDVGPAANTYPFRYTGQRLDPATGLYDDKARDYSPALGRFLQTDPAGLDQGPNLYEYAASDPVDAGDPSGMCKGADCAGGEIGDATRVDSTNMATTVSMAVSGQSTSAQTTPGAPTAATPTPRAAPSKRPANLTPAQGGSGFSSLSPDRPLEQQKQDFAAAGRAADEPEDRAQLVRAGAGTIFTGVALGAALESAPVLAARARAFLGPAGPMFGRAQFGGSALFQGARLRIGWGYREATDSQVFRAAGTWIDRALGQARAHIDLFEMRNPPEP